MSEYVDLCPIFDDCLIKIKDIDDCKDNYELCVYFNSLLKKGFYESLFGIVDNDDYLE